MSIQSVVRIVDENTFELIDEIDELDSIIVKSSWRGIGSLQITVHRMARAANKLKMGRYLFVLGKNDTIYRILHKKTLKGNQNFIEVIAISQESLMAQRMTVPPLLPNGNQRISHYYKSGSAETVMKSLVIDNLNNGNAIRRISRLKVSADKGRGQNFSLESRFQVISDDLEKISTITGVGWNIAPSFKTKELIFETQMPVDRTARNTNGNTPIILSVDNGSLLDIEYTESMTEFANFVWVGGQGEGIERIIATASNKNGYDKDISDFNLFEIFLDATDVPIETQEDGKDPIPRPPADINADLVDRGNKKMAETPYVVSLLVQIDPLSHRVFGRDYHMGDYVTIEDIELDITMDTQIIGVEEVVEEGVYNAYLLLGDDVPTLRSKMIGGIKDIKRSNMK